MDERYGPLNSPLRNRSAYVYQFLLDDAVETRGKMESSASMAKPSNFFFCVPIKNGLHILNLYYRTIIWKYLDVDSAIVDPTGNVLAVKYQDTVQLFDVGDFLKVTMTQYYHPEAGETELYEYISLYHYRGEGGREIGEPKNLGLDFVFWKWISAEKIVLVTSEAVYHWTVQGDSPPVRIFDRDHDLAGYEIFDYRTDANQNWLLLIGQCTEQDRVVGKMQLFSVENQQHNRVFDGQIAAFSEFKMEFNDEPSILLCYATSNGVGWQLNVEELGTPLGDNERFKKQNSEIPFSFVRDFPIGIEVNLEQGVIFLMTRRASIHFYDLESGTYFDTLDYVPAETENINILFAVSHVWGILGLDRNGKVFYYRVDEENVVGFIRQISTELAMKMAQRNNWTGAEDLFVQKFNTLLNTGQYADAIKIAIKSPNGFLRTNDTFLRLKDVVSRVPLMDLYFRILEHCGLQINAAEEAEKSTNPPQFKFRNTFPQY